MHLRRAVMGTSKRLRIVPAAVVLALVLAMLPGLAMAKKGSDGETRGAFYGVVDARPEGRLQGMWVIGGRTFTADDRTEFDQAEGDLQVGGCAKVEVRNGRVHEIDSEPRGDCP